MYVIQKTHQGTQSVNTVKLISFMGTKCHCLMMMDVFVDTPIR